MWKISFMTFMSVAVVFSEVNAVCDVATDKDECCVFPFKYKGKTYESCTFVESASKAWCGLTSDVDDDRKWGYCKFKTCQVKTTDGDCCVFPFTFHGTSYDACTNVFDSNPWCGTKPKVDFWTREPRGNCRTYAEPCFNNPCQNNGVCQSDRDRFYCNCTEDYEGKTCSEKVFPCGKIECEHGGTCQNNDEEFKCLCLEGYTGITCGSIIVDPCKVSPCKNGGKCFSDITKEDYYCRCPQGYEGITCKKRVYPCDSSPCQNDGTCQNNEENFLCNCTVEYGGGTCETRVDPCGISPCKNGGKCLSDLAEFTFSCSCSEGYGGETCETKVYPCDSSPCENSGTCENNENSFQCTCPEQYEGETCEIRVDPCKNSPCKNGGKCLSDVPEFTFSCRCLKGYEGEACETRVYPCDSSPCENNGTCENNEDNFQCNCSEQYEGYTCEIKVDPCKINPCENGGECFSDLSKDEFLCSCKAGYEGKTCSEKGKVYPCDSSPCQHGGICENNRTRNFVCNCPERYEGDSCSIQVDPCKTNPCKNGGECLSNLSEFTFSCSCPVGFEGETCEKKVYPCDSSPCENDGTCENNEDTFQCTCPERYEGDTCELTVYPCESSPCKNGGKCLSDLPKFTFSCSCPVGYEGETCENRVYPCDSEPCGNNGTCENSEDTFQCTCSQKYEGETCEIQVDPCESSPCKNGGHCSSDLSEFTFLCGCPEGYEGKACEKKVDPCENSPCKNGGTCKRNGHDFICECSKTGFKGPNCAWPNEGFWSTVTELTPPFHIAADGHGDLGARFVDLNGDGRMDFVFHRWITASNIQKGAYLNIPNKGFVSAPQFTPPFHIAANGFGDLGARFVDLNDDGKIDMVYHRWLGKNNVQKGAYLNTGSGWLWAPQYTPPFHIAAAKGNQDLGARFVELNGDGKIDFVFHRWMNKNHQQKGAFLNTGNGWANAPDFTPPFHIAANGYGDLGARFADLNGDGKEDFIYHRWLNLFYQQKGAYINNGKKWVWAPKYTPPFHIAADNVRDTGLRLIDFNGDGKIDMVYHRWLNAIVQQKGAYLNNGKGWTKSPAYTPPFHIAADKQGDLGARFADVNGDGLVDFVYHRWINTKTQQKGAYINSGCGWRSEPKYIPLYHIAANGFRDLGARFVDLNGDGATDLAYHRWINPTTTQKGAYLACGDTNPAFCLNYSKYCSMWKMAYNMCRFTCNTCQL